MDRGLGGTSDRDRTQVEDSGEVSDNAWLFSASDLMHFSNLGEDRATKAGR